MTTRGRVPAAVDLWASPGPFYPRELAAVLRCSTRYVEKLIASGALPAARLGRQIRIPASAARRLALSAGVEPANNTNQANQANGGEPSQAHPGFATMGTRKVRV